MNVFFVKLTRLIRSAFSSFPDSLQFEQGSEIHSFRIRVYPKSPEVPAEDVREEQRPQPLDGFMYGFSHFYQKRDPTSKRGYQQASSRMVLEPPQRN